MERKVIIIGSGPSGLTASIYAARAALDPLVIEGISAGGQLMLTSDVENFPGFPKGITGPELITNMKEQSKRLGTEFLMDNVENVDFSTRPFTIKTTKDEFKAHSVIIATGASARLLGIESEKNLMGSGVSTCAVCDAFFYKGKKVAVVGGGDSALEEAIYLTKFADKVSIIHRRDEFRGSKIMQERAFENKKIEIIWDSIVDEVLDKGTGQVTGIKLKNKKTGAFSELECDGVFIAIGHIPNTQVFKGHIELDDEGYIILKNRMETSVKGVFAAGDVHDTIYRQAITSAGAGSCLR